MRVYFDFNRTHGKVIIKAVKGEKGDVGYPTELQVIEALQEILPQHPDWVTTVLDGAIATRKLADGAVTLDKLASALRAVFADDFSEEEDYAKSSYCFYSGKLYKFKAYHEAGEWIGTDAEEVTITDELTGGYVYTDDGDGNITISERE